MDTPGNMLKPKKRKPWFSFLKPNKQRRTQLPRQKQKHNKWRHNPEANVKLNAGNSKLKSSEVKLGKPNVPPG